MVTPDKDCCPCLVDSIIDIFAKVFGEDIRLINRCEAPEHMGYFSIRLKYPAHDYDILFESERGVFDIGITDPDGACNSLYRIKKFNSGTNIENIDTAIQILKETLEKNDFYLYFSKPNKKHTHQKLYRKKGNECCRVKNWLDEFDRS